MGKYHPICELTGTKNYAQWHHQIMLALKGEHLWNQCSNGTNPNDFTELALSQPIPADPTTIKTNEREKILDWLAKDAQAKGLIDRKVSIVVTSQLSNNQMFSRNELLSQYELRTWIHMEKLKDAKDAPCYLGVFEGAHCRLIQMGVTYSNDETTFNLLQGLPDIIKWQIFKEFTMNCMSSTISTTTPTTTSSTASSTLMPLAFDDMAKQFTEKANVIVRK
ncbi:hypothetical protein V8E55_007189 [Tylopilus felleus]